MGNTNENGREDRIRWHDAFVAAMKLEMKESASGMDFYPEYELTGRPKYIDLLIVKRDDIISGSASDNSFISLFTKYNVIEYKGVGGVMDMDVVANGMAYACMYKKEKSDQESAVRNFGDMTLTFVRESKPVKLFRHLEIAGCSVDRISDGVYSINVTALFCVQVIVTGEIGFDRHPWLSALTRKLDELQAGKLVELESRAATDWEHDNAEEVMDAAIAANRDVFERIRGGSGMCKAMWELMKPEIDAYVAETMAERDRSLVQKDKSLARKNKSLAQKNKKIAEQEQEIERLNKIIAELSVG